MESPASSTDHDESPTVFIVDDDPSVVRLVRHVLDEAEIRSREFSSAEQFLETGVDGLPGCVLCDLELGGMNGLELQKRLAAAGSRLPFIILTAHGRVSAAVEAMKNNAVDFLEKPFERSVLLDRVRKALALNEQARRREQSRADALNRISRLTERERQVMRMVVSGMSNKQIAIELDLSEKTIEAHRAAVMRKTGCVSLPELVRLAEFE